MILIVVVPSLWSDEIKNREYVLYPTTERRPREVPEEADLIAFICGSRNGEW